MRADRTKPEKYWTNLGRRAFNIGMSLEAALGSIKYPKVIEWVTTGYTAEQQRKFRKAPK